MLPGQLELPGLPVIIVLDVPLPPSTNRLWRMNSRSTKPYRSGEYKSWCAEADMAIMAARAYPQHRIGGPFEVALQFSRLAGRGDSDNRIKAILDWCQAVELIRNDSDCERGTWEWTTPENAPKGCRVTLRSLTG